MAKQPSGRAFKRLKLGENAKRVIIPGLVVNEPHNERGGVLDNWEHSDLKTTHWKAGLWRLEQKCKKLPGHGVDVGLAW